MACRIPTGISQAHKDAGLKFDGSKALPANLVRPFPGLGGIRFEENVATSNFNSLQVAVNRRFSRGFSYSIAYTFSKAMGVAAGDGSFVNPFNVRLYDYRLLDFDRTHAFTATYIYDVPKLGRNWATTSSPAACSTGGRFQGSPLISGNPFELASESVAASTPTSASPAPGLNRRASG